jgi:hypothetical protein
MVYVVVDIYNSIGMGFPISPPHLVLGRESPCLLTNKKSWIMATRRTTEASPDPSQFRVGVSEGYKFLPSSTRKTYRLVRGSVGYRISPDLYKSIVTGKMVVVDWELASQDAGQIAWYEPENVTPAFEGLVQTAANYDAEALTKAKLLSDLLG